MDQKQSKKPKRLLDTRRDVRTAWRRRGGFIIVLKSPRHKSRVHAAGCRTLYEAAGVHKASDGRITDMSETDNAKSLCGGGQKYYQCTDAEDARQVWRHYVSAGGKLKIAWCSFCRPVRGAAAADAKPAKG